MGLFDEIRKSLEDALKEAQGGQQQPPPQPRPQAPPPARPEPQRQESAAQRRPQEDADRRHATHDRRERHEDHHQRQRRPRQPRAFSEPVVVSVQQPEPETVREPPRKRRRRRPAARVPTGITRDATSPQDRLHDPKALREAIILSEILAPPLALRRRGR